MPLAARCGPPETGASSNRMPLTARRSATDMTNAGATVDDTITIAPGVSALTAPCAPNSTVSICAASTTSRMTIEASCATPAAADLALAPAATAAASASGLMSRATTPKPLRTRLWTTPRPIAPVPMTPMVGSAGTLRLLWLRRGVGLAVFELARHAEFDERQFLALAA